MSSDFTFITMPNLGWSAEYVGVPWQWQGRSIEAGVDCWGLLVLAYAQHFSFQCEDFLEAQRSQSGAGQIRVASKLIHENIKGWAEISEPAVGVGVLMRTSTAPVHVGICVDDENLLHADESLGSVVCERLSDVRENILGFFVPRSVLNKEIASP